MMKMNNIPEKSAWRREFLKSMLRTLLLGGIAFTGAKFWLLKDDYEREGRAVRWHEIGNIDIFSASRLLPYNYTIGNILENNEVHHPLMELADGNCIYTNTSGKGNIVRNNYVHHLGGQHTKQSGWAIRTDDYVIGTKIYNNIVEETTGCFMLKQHNDIYNNYTFNLLPGFRPDIMIKKGPVNNGMVKRNICYTNTSRQTVVGAKSKDLFKQADIDSNLFYSAGADGRLHRQYKDDLNANREYQGENSLYADPKFYPVDNRDFRLKPGSPAFGLGIEAINASRIGLLENFPFADTTEGIRRLFIETAERDLSVLRLSRIGAKGELKLTARTETGYLADLSKFEVSFNSQDTELAVVNNQGTVTAKTKGETTIEARVKTNKGTKTIQIAVTVAS